MSDLWGQIIWDYYKGKKVKAIMERDDGDKHEENLAQYFADFKDWLPEERKAMAFAKGKVLDVGCGPGRHILYLQRKGLHVTGIDISLLAVKVAKLRGAKDAKVMSIYGLKFKPKTFDTLIMMCNGFGLAGSISKTKKLLKSFYKITKPDARIIASAIDPYKTTKQAHLKYQEANRKRGRPGGLVTIRHIYKGKKSDWWDLLLASPEEVTRICKGTGWKIYKLLKNKKGWNIYILAKI